MANIDRIVKVDISLNTTGITSEGFNTICVVGPHVCSASRVLSITDPDELLELGFSSDDPIYLAVNDAFSQTPSPDTVKVGRLACDTVRVGFVTEPAEGLVYTVTITTTDDDGEAEDSTYTYTAASGDEASTVLAALAALINEGSAASATTTTDDEEEDSEVDSSATSSAIVVEDEETETALSAYATAEVSDAELVITMADPDVSFTVSTCSYLEVTGVERTESVDIAENMSLITAADNDFYGIVLTSRDQDDIIAMADWTESHTKLFGTSIAEAGAYSSEVTSDTGSKLKSGSYYRSFWFYHADADTDYPEAAVMARCFSVDPGGETWALKKLSAVTTDNLTETQYNAVTAKNGNTFEEFRNVTITQNGMVAAGEWIDVIRFRDWLTDTIQTEVLSAMINRDKLPYTDAGIAVIENVINSVLVLGQRRGGIAPTEYDEDGNKNYGFVITVPLASSISANVKAQRTLEDVSFTARLAGAIHAVEITGSLTYENLQDSA